MIIHLGLELLQGSSSLPVNSASRVSAYLFEIAPNGGYRVSPKLNWLVSVALFLALLRMAVSHHSALWSPDFPPTLICVKASDHLKNTTPKV
jgi:hypothetical protein